MKKISLLLLLMLTMSFAAVAQTPKTTYNIKTLAPTVTGNQILEQITKSYKGKVVLVDFWATWCGPCRAAMKEVDQIKADLVKRGAVFVYITGETSPLADWQAMIKQIAGDHYRLSDAQWSYLGESLGMRGIPAYMILNKDGSVAWSNITQGGYPGNDLVQTEMIKALGK